MDESQLYEIFKEIEAAGLSCEIDPTDDESVMNFIEQRLGNEISPKECADDEKLLDLYLKQEELKLKIKKEKKKGSYDTFHNMLLKGELKITDPFAIDILCKKI